jgi:glycerate dehydrogenase
MGVLVHTRRRVTDPAVMQVELDELFRRSDSVTLHCPLTPETRGLVDRRRLRLMKRTAFLVNVARGAIVREADLVDALYAEELAGAALDVQDPEPPAPGSPLYQLEQVVLTPHIGWKPVEARQRLVELVARNIAAHGEGRAVNRVA